MALYRIHRIKETQREQFRAAPHVSAPAAVKPRDYEAAGEVEAEHEYAAWSALRSGERPIQLGDLLENESGELRICKYVGFEPAVWAVPDAGAHRPAEKETS